MTRVNVHFEAPENQFGVELNERSQRAWDRYEAEDDDGLSSDLWDAFLMAFEDQMREYMGTGGCIDEVYEDFD